MIHKRGLSKIVTTILVIAVSIVALVIISMFVMNLINKGSNKVILDRFVINTGIESAKLNYSNSLANIKVKREIGSGNLVGLKFIFEDKKSAEVFERRFVSFDELESRTFEINVSEGGSQLILFEVHSVSIAPIILLENGEEIIGEISDTVDGLNKVALGMGGSQEEEEEEIDICYANRDCGTDHAIGDAYCSGLDVYQYWRVYICELGFCTNEMTSLFLETCDYECLGGICRDELLGCTNETIVESCGSNGYISLPSCSQTGEQVVREYRTFSCPEGFCKSDIEQIIVKVCEEGEVCNEGECFVPLECVEHIECGGGEVCELGSCVPETPLNQGAISSTWPFGIGEFFDSVQLTDPEIDSYVGKYIHFDTGIENRCMRILQHLWPAKPEGYPYVRLNETETNITEGDTYSIYETNYFCNGAWTGGGA